MGEDSARRLQLVGSLQFPSVVLPHTIAYEPRTDLVAAISKHGDIFVYRRSGQRALHIEASQTEGKALCLEWAEQGDALLIGTDTGKVQTVTMQASKLKRDDKRVRTIADGTRAVVGIKADSFSWSHRPRVASIFNQYKKLAENVEVLENLHWGEQLHTTTSPRDSVKDPNLSEALAQIDTMSVTPRLASTPLPSKTGPGLPPPQIKAPKIDMDVLLQPRNDLTRHYSAAMYVVLDDSSVNVSSTTLFQHTYAKDATQIKAALQRSASGSDRHVIVQHMDIDSAGRPCLREASVHIDLYEPPFTTVGTVHTSTIVKQTLELQSISAYLSHAINIAVIDWNNLSAVPYRFIANINETLGSNDEGTVDQQLTQLLLTGQCSETVVEWLKDELTERGHKRWDVAMTTMFDAISHLLEVNIIPAIERCTYIVATLRGLAKYFESSKAFNVSPSLFTNVIDRARSMNMIANRALGLNNDEAPRYAAFSSWLRGRVDLAASEPGSNATQELLDSLGVKTDTSAVLSYLRAPFNASRLRPILQRQPPEAMNAADDANKQDDQEMTSELLEKEPENALWHLPTHMVNLQRQIDACLTAIERWQTTAWQDCIALRGDMQIPITAVDVRADDAHEADFVTSTTLCGIDVEDSSTLTAMTLKTNMKSQTLVGPRLSVRLPEGHSFIDQKLAGNGQVLAIVARADNIRSLIDLPLPEQCSSSNDMELSVETVRSMTIHDFEEDSLSVPAYLFISEGVHHLNVLILDEKCRRWQNMRLPVTTSMSRNEASARARVDKESDEMMVD